MEYDDGGAPPTEIINKWLDVVQTTFHDAPDSSGPNGNEGPAIAVHCVAGLGRAPVLVAIALIEYGKVSWHAFRHRLFPGCGKAGRAITMRATRAWYLRRWKPNNMCRIPHFGCYCTVRAQNKLPDDPFLG